MPMVVLIFRIKENWKIVRLRSPRGFTCQLTSTRNGKSFSGIGLRCKDKPIIPPYMRWTLAVLGGNRSRRCVLKRVSGDLCLAHPSKHNPLKLGVFSQMIHAQSANDDTADAGFR